MLHRLLLRLVVELRGFLRLTDLLSLTGKVGLLSGELLLKVLRSSLVIHLLLRLGLIKDLLQRFVLCASLFKRRLIILRRRSICKLLGLLAHAELRH